MPAAWVISIAPHLYASSLGKFDNKHPRSYVSDTHQDQSIDKCTHRFSPLLLSSMCTQLTLRKATKALINRCEGAQMNGFENIGLFAAAVVAGNIAKLDNWTLNALSGGYLAVRVVYTALYINGTTDAMANARTATFLTSVGLVWTLFIKSGNALRSHL